MKITMDGEYAFEDEPTEKVRILCVDAPGGVPVVVMTIHGSILHRRVDGSGVAAAPALIHLQRKPREFWVNVCPKYSVLHKTEHSALHNCMSNGKTIHVREVLE